MRTNSLFQIEYVIWGKPSGCNDEKLLVSTYKGRPITSKPMIEAMSKDLVQMGCTDLRIQEIDFSINAMDAFVNSLNTNKLTNQ